MNPYLENPELWSAVHSRLIVAIADELVEHLSEKYRVEVEKRVYFSSDDGSVLVGIPDVSVATSRSAQTPTGTVTLPLPVQPETVTVPLAEEVTELLSPKNKRPGEGRMAYLRKRNQVLASVSHLVEIDLLRGGQPLPITSGHASDYRILVSQADRRPMADLYGFDLRQSIPPFPVPLMLGEEAPILALQPLLNRVYEKGRYHLAIDYAQPPVPPLGEEDEQWVAAQIQKALG
jgi:hypothetical protein